MKFYVSTYTEGFFGEGPNGSKGIYLCEFDETSNEFKVLDSFSNSVNPSFIKLDREKKNLFVACEKLPPSMIDNYAVNEDGSLTFNDSKVLDYRSCCYISADTKNKFVAVANYGTGEVFTYSFDDNFKYKELTSSYRNDKVGPNVERQDLPHAHSVRLIEALNTYVACDLGCDKISFYDYKNEGYFIPSNINSIDTSAGYGPRHTANSLDGKYLYVTCELMNRVLVYQLVENQYKLIQDISSIDDCEGENLVADIHISDDDKYIFVSNRGLDNIVQYERKSDGTLNKVSSSSTYGKGPRNFTLCSDYIICANQDSNDCKVLEIKNGLLTGKVLGSHEFISPVCIEKL